MKQYNNIYKIKDNGVIHMAQLKIEHLSDAGGSKILLNSRRKL